VQDPDNFGHDFFVSLMFLARFFVILKRIVVISGRIFVGIFVILGRAFVMFGLTLMISERSLVDSAGICLILMISGRSLGGLCMILVFCEILLMN